MIEPLLTVDDLRKEFAHSRRSTAPIPIVAVDGVSLAAARWGFAGGRG